MPQLSARPLPLGAALFPDNHGAPGIATTIFDWTPAGNQEGAYDITYTASDGALGATRTARITVCGLTDTDCDGLNDAWERLYFGSLGRDGSGDRDDDGISDLDEYRNGTDPTRTDANLTLHLPAGLSFFAYPGAVPPAHATCQSLLASLGETGAQSSLMRVDAAAQRVVTCRVGDAEDFALVTGEGYVARLVAPRDLPVSRASTCTVPALSAGVNLRGHPMPSAGLTCYAWLAALGVDRLTAIARLDPLTGRFATCAYAGEGAAAAPVGPDFPILQGEGYRLTAPVGGVLALPGCR